MKTKYFFLAALAAIFASCANEEYIGDNGPNATLEQTGDGSIQFGFDMQNATRGDIYGNAAATLLGNAFYVMGTKGTEALKSPTPDKVFDNYLVHYGMNTAGTTESNTANWEYVGVTPGTGSYTNWVKLSSASSQTIKYWDYSVPQYDFLAFSTGTFKAIAAPTRPATPASDEIGVTAMKFGVNLASSNVAYKFDLPSIKALENAYISDITKVVKANYGKEVQLKFKNLGSKVRIALYETVPGYSVKASSVKFYTVDGTTAFTTDAKGTDAALISENASSFASKGVISVYFPNVGTNNKENENYNKAAATVTENSVGATKKTFDPLASATYATAEGSETAGSLYLGRTLPAATFAGDKNAAYYKTVFPVSTSYPLTLRVDYTLVSTDGSGEEITVLGAKAVVPASYTVWQPNYAYTYIFKISDNTNGWTDPAGVVDGLFPITFDAVVAEATDASGDQTTVTTVATPSITTYQQGHNSAKDGKFTVADEYDNDGKKLYVQVMDNNLSPAVLVGTGGSTLYKLNTQTADATPTDRSLLYAVTGTKISEASVMDALVNQYDVTGGGVITGRNGIVITPNANIDNDETSIEIGVDDNPITVGEGEAAEINLPSLTDGTYAYVYDYTNGAKGFTTIYQPIATSISSPVGVHGKYYIAASALRTWDDGTSDDHYSEAGTPNSNYIYFSVTTNGGDTKTYSFVSVDGKTTIPAGLLKVPVSSLTATTAVQREANASADTFYFDKYTRNTGKYAVKVFKVVD